MVGKHSKVKKSKPLMGNHQKCWIWGRNSVRETLSAGFWKIWELYLSEKLPTAELTEIETRARELSIPVVLTSDKTLTQKSRAGDHQGMIAKMAPFPYTTAEQILEQKSETPLYLILDRVQDPYNFGAIIRSAEILGADAIFIGMQEQCDVTSLVCRTSAGAVNHVPLAQVPDLAAFCQQLKSLNINVLGTAMQAEETLVDYAFPQPTALIVGNEGTGLHPDLISACSHLIRIPQQGRTESLNVAVSAGILLYEASRQRGFE